jgi:hypothetical protein
VARYENDVFKDNPTNFSAATKTYTFNFTSQSQIGTEQKFVLTASITTTSGIMTDTAEVRITILPDCSVSQLVDKTITNMSILVSQTATQDIFFADTTSEYYANPNFCGGSTGRTLTWTPSPLPAFLSVNGSKNTLTLSTSDPA